MNQTSSAYSDFNQDPGPHSKVEAHDEEKDIIGQAYEMDAWIDACAHQQFDW